MSSTLPGSIEDFRLQSSWTAIVPEGVPELELPSFLEGVQQLGLPSALSAPVAWVTDLERSADGQKPDGAAGADAEKGADGQKNAGAAGTDQEEDAAEAKGAGAAGTPYPMGDLRKELNSIKVETLHDMVQFVHFSLNNSQVKSHLLYLTNSQASSIGMARMPLVRKKIGLREPKMVIRLMPSRFGSNYWNAFPHSHADKCEGRYPFRHVSEVSDEDQMHTEHKLFLLAKDVLLPLAVKASALVMGNESCALAYAFVKVSAPLQRLMGDDCPFSIVIFARAHFFHLKSGEADTITSRFRERNEQWKQVSKTPPSAKDSSDGSVMGKALRTRYGDDQAYWPHEELFSGDYSLVMFECLNPAGQLALEVCDHFQNDFIQSLALKLPVIALQTYGTDRMDLVPTMADHVSRGMPLFLLDSRDRRACPVPKDLDELEAGMWSTLRALHERRVEDKDRGTEKVSGLCDLYTTSLLAYVKTAVDYMVNGPDDRNAGAQQPHSMQRKQWIFKAIERAQQELTHTRRRSDRVEEKDDKRKQMEARRHMETERTFMKATDLLIEYAGQDAEWEVEQMHLRFREGLEDVALAEDWEDLRDRFDKNWLKFRGCSFHTYKAADALAKRHAWCTYEDFGRDTAKGRKRLVVAPERAGGADFRAAWGALDELLRKELDISSAYDRRSKTKAYWKSRDHLWLSLHNLLKADNVYTGNLFNLEPVKRCLFDLAQIERLPPKNTLETLLLLRRAWVLVDVFHANANYYKAFCKVSQLLALVVSVCVVTTTLLAETYKDSLEEEVWQYLLQGLTLTGSFITGAVVFVDPLTKWSQLRGSALRLESEIWKFRTRTGVYSSSSSAMGTPYISRGIAEQKAEQALQAAIVMVQDAVQQKSGLTDTSFYSTTTATADAWSDPDPLDGRIERSVTVAVAGSVSGFLCCARRGPKTKQQMFMSKAHYKHGQYDGGMHGFKDPPEEDNFHSPAPPEVYIKYRLMPQMAFYKKRIPGYARRRRVFQVLLMSASLLSALLAAINELDWTVIVASITGALAAWQEFTGLAKKLERHSGAATNLAHLLLWWQTLSDVDRKNVRSMDELVERMEGVLSSEHDAWVSHSRQAAQVLKQQQKDGEANSPSRAS